MLIQWMCVHAHVSTCQLYDLKRLGFIWCQLESYTSSTLKVWETAFSCMLLVLQLSWLVAGDCCNVIKNLTPRRDTTTSYSPTVLGPSYVQFTMSKGPNVLGPFVSSKCEFPDLLHIFSLTPKVMPCYFFYWHVPQKTPFDGNLLMAWIHHVEWNYFLHLYITPGSGPWAVIASVAEGHKLGVIVSITQMHTTDEYATKLISLCMPSYCKLLIAIKRNFLGDLCNHKKGSVLF